MFFTTFATTPRLATSKTALLPKIAGYMVWYLSDHAPDPFNSFLPFQTPLQQDREQRLHLFAIDTAMSSHAQVAPLFQLLLKRNTNEMTKKQKIIIIRHLQNTRESISMQHMRKKRADESPVSAWNTQRLPPSHCRRSDKRRENRSPLQRDR